MLNKIAFKALRQKWRDYSVLLIGTTIAVAIFYMFTNIAMNEELLLSLSTMTQKMIVFVFVLGQILLGVITFVYLNFANSFLVRLRQKDYGLLSMLGATKHQIGSLLLRETLLLGLISSILGVFVGMGITKLSGQALMQSIGIKLSHWSVGTPKVVLVTIGFFLLIFLFNGLYNRWRLMRLDTLTLLQADHVASAKKVNPKRQLILGLLGIILLGISYAIMPKVVQWQMVGLTVDLILNVTGTYLFVGQTLGLVTYWIGKSEFGQKGLRNFINGQLRFRLDEYKRILTMIAVLFGLALGAISVGQGYYVSLPKQAVENDALTLATKNPKTDLADLKDVTYQAQLDYVVKDQTVYFNKDSVKNAQVPTLVYQQNGQPDAKPKQTSVDVNHPEDAYTLSTLANYVTGVPFGSDVQLVNQLPAGKQETIKLVKVKDLQANESILKKMAANEKSYMSNPDEAIPGAYGNLISLKTIFGGLEFMSIFLGIAFLIMLASTLMFKTLSNVSLDRRRYEILAMIGTTPQQLRLTAFKDVGILFFIPMLIGLVDATMGMQIFKPIMPDPYSGFSLGLVLVLGIYGGYYILTSLIYQRLVLKK